MGPGAPRLSCNGQPVDAVCSYDAARRILTVSAPAVDPARDRLEADFDGKPALCPNDVEGELFRRLYRAEIEYACKERIFGALLDGAGPLELLGLLPTLALPPAVRGALDEVLLAETR